MKTEEKYAALIFDVVGSRKLEDRLTAQEDMKDVTELLNYIYKDNMVKEVVCSSGDEFQGLFKNTSSAFAYIRSLQLYLYPIRVRCGIGYGTVKYLEPEWNSNYIDGNAYYNARDAIKAIPGTSSSDLIIFNTQNSMDKIINTILLTGSDLKKNQSGTSKLIELILDFYFPYLETEKTPEILERFAKLIKKKNMKKIEEQKKKKYNFEKDFNFDSITEEAENFDYKREVNFIYEESKILKSKDKTLYYDEFLPRGCSTLIAPITLTTRQNINKYITYGNIKVNRNLDGAIFDLLNKLDKGEII